MNEEINDDTKLQINVYTKWVADKLKNVGTCKVEDVTKDLSDGTVLIELAEILTKTKAKPVFHKKAFSLVQKVEKCNEAIRIFKNNGIKLDDSISGKDIYDKNVKQTLYLIWMLILHYSIDLAVRDVKAIEQISDQQDTQNENSIKLISWATNNIKHYKHVKDKFKPYGLSTCALINKYYPNEINYEQLDKDDHETNIMIANQAMEKLQIPIYVTPEDIKHNNYNVDETCLVTQLAAIKNRLERRKKGTRPSLNELSSNKSEEKFDNVDDESPKKINDKEQTKRKRNLSQKKVKISTRNPDDDDQTNIRSNTESKQKNVQSSEINDDKNELPNTDDFKKGKNSSRSSDLFPIKDDSTSKTSPKQSKSSNKRKIETKNIDIEPNNIPSNTIFKTNFDVRNQIEKVDCAVQPDFDDSLGDKKFSNHSENDQFINSNKKKHVNTVDFGVQPDSDHHPLKLTNSSDFGSNSYSKSTNKRHIEKTNKGVQPDDDSFHNQNSGNTSPKRTRNNYQQNTSSQNTRRTKNTSNQSFNSGNASNTRKSGYSFDSGSDDQDNDTNSIELNDKKQTNSGYIDIDAEEIKKALKKNNIETRNENIDLDLDIDYIDDEDDDKTGHNNQTNTKPKQSDIDSRNKKRNQINIFDSEIEEEESDNEEYGNRIRLRNSVHSSGIKRKQQGERKKSSTNNLSLKQKNDSNIRKSSYSFNSDEYDQENDNRLSKNRSHNIISTREVGIHQKRTKSTLSDNDIEIVNDHKRSSKNTIEKNKTNTNPSKTRKKRQIESRNYEINPSEIQTRNVSLVPKDSNEVAEQNAHKKERHNRNGSVSESGSRTKKLKIKVNGNIDRQIVITVRNFSHHHNRNESVHSHSRDKQNSPSDSPSKYRSHTPRHTKRSSSITNKKPISYSVPSTPKKKLIEECSIIPVYNNDDGNKSPGRSVKVQVRNQDFHVKKKFNENVSGFKILLNDNDSQKEEQNNDQ